MPIIKRRTDDDRPANEQDLYDWVNNLPPQANVHAREASGYVGSFPAYEIQTGEPVEEYLMARYGVGTYELAGHSQGLFLAGRHTVHIGSYAERQAARRVHATQDAQEGGSMFSNLEQLVGIVKTLGLTPGNQGNQGQDELVATLMQQAVQSLRPPDPEKAMGQAFDFLKSVNEFQRSTAPPPRPRPRPKRKRKRKESAESESGVGQMLGTALFVGADLAMRNPATAQRITNGITANARRAGNWFTRKTQAGADGKAGPQATPTSAYASMTLDQAIESAKAMIATPVGHRLLETVRGAVPRLTPEQIARKGLEGARQWLGPDHPLLLRLRENPGRVFDEMADIVGLVEEPWWNARGHFIAMMADEGDDARTPPPADGAANPAEAENDQTLEEESTARDEDGRASEDAAKTRSGDGVWITSPEPVDDEPKRSEDPAGVDGDDG